MNAYQRVAPALAIVMSLAALCLGGAVASGKIIITSSRQIANGVVKSADLKNGTVSQADLGADSVGSAEIDANAVGGEALAPNSVGSEEIAPNAVGSEEIAPNAVGPQDVELPPPAEVQEPPIEGGVGNRFGPVAALGAPIQKVEAESALEVTWTGTVQGGTSTACVYQLRVDGQPAPSGGVEAIANPSVPSNVSVTGIFTGLPVGQHQIEVWAKFTSYAGAPNGPTCDLGTAGVQTTAVVSEAIQ